MADSPNPVDVKKALTFKGATVAWAILKRHKIIESRPVRLPTGGWIAAHVGKGAFKGDYSGSNTKLPLGRVFESKIHGLHCWFI